MGRSSNSPPTRGRGEGEGANAGEGSTSSSPLPLAYCTDVSAIPTESWRHLTGLDTLVLDALRFRNHPTHLTIDQACTVAERVGARQTFFIHIAHDVKHSEVDPTLPEGVNLAYDGLVLEQAAGSGQQAAGSPPAAREG
jgi:ribonuclease BN (tRNA processing enzyme)